MKKIFTVILLLVSPYCFSQATTTDTALTKKVEELSKSVQALKQKADAANKPEAKANAKDAKADACSIGKHLSFQQKLVVLSPIILSLIFIVYSIVRLRKEGFKLSDALAEDNPVQRQIENPKFDPKNVTNEPALITVVDFPKSSSRLLAFFSGLAALTISITTVSYFFYIYFRTGDIPDFDKLFNIILALGIGITPYAFNKVSKAINSNS